MYVCVCVLSIFASDKCVTGYSKQTRSKRRDFTPIRSASRAQTLLICCVRIILCFCLCARAVRSVCLHRRSPCVKQHMGRTPFLCWSATRLAWPGRRVATGPTTASDERCVRHIKNTNEQTATAHTHTMPPTTALGGFMSYFHQLLLRPFHMNVL